MEFSGIFSAFLIIVVLAIGWIILRTVFKLTVQLFSLGCFVIVVLVGLGWLLGWIGQ
jgi:hypothetical protein